MKSKKEFKKPYQKPAIEQVRLIAEEAVLVSCKVNKVSGPAVTGKCKATGQDCSAPGT